MGQFDLDGIPVAWCAPPRTPVGISLWLPFLGGSTERVQPMLDRLSGAGFAAISFDPPGQGRRGSGDPVAYATDVLAAFRRRMWPLLGRTTLESLRVLDWAEEQFGRGLPIVAGGVSMGGDVAVALAGIDARVRRVSALVATPDWRRPHMHHLNDPAQLIDQGVADTYAQWYADRLNPVTHLDAYRRDVAISFHSGADDRHVPADDARAFREALIALDPAAGERIEVVVETGAGHLDVDDRFSEHAVDWLTAGSPANS